MTQHTETSARKVQAEVVVNKVANGTLMVDRIEKEQEKLAILVDSLLSKVESKQKGISALLKAYVNAQKAPIDVPQGVESVVISDFCEENKNTKEYVSLLKKFGKLNLQKTVLKNVNKRISVCESSLHVSIRGMSKQLSALHGAICCNAFAEWQDDSDFRELEFMLNHYFYL